MGKDTGISWTTHTFNPWWGCTEASPGCDNCFAREVDARWGGAQGHWGKGVPRREFGDAHWNEPLVWNRAAAKLDRIDLCFIMSMGDVMDDEAPAGARERLWSLIDRTPYLLHQLLTKRPHRFHRYLPATGFLHDNVILGATMENQQFYDARIDLLSLAAASLTERNRTFHPSEDLLRPRRAVQTFCSYEPAIGPLTMRGRTRPSWMIFGGETGGGAKADGAGLG